MDISYDVNISCINTSVFQYIFYIKAFVTKTVLSFQSFHAFGRFWSEKFWLWLVLLMWLDVILLIFTFDIKLTLFFALGRNIKGREMNAHTLT